MVSNLHRLIYRNLREAVALYLWQSYAVKVNLDDPFKLASGNFSPIYINCRQVISDPTFMDLFVTTARLLLERENVAVDMIAGGVTAGVPFGAYLASGTAKPFIYVRKATKGYGLANLVEGRAPEGKKVLLVEDLITNAGSKLGFIESIRDAGGTVEDVLVLFDRQQGGLESLKERNINLHSIADMDSVLRVAEIASIFSQIELETVKKYLSNPKQWHENQGLEFNE